MAHTELDLREQGVIEDILNAKIPQPARPSITFDRSFEFRDWRKLKPSIGTESWYYDPQAP